MHELALAEDIVRAVRQQCDCAPGDVRRIALRVGTLSGVNVDSLEFGMEAALEARGMGHVEVTIEPEPATVRCACGRAYRPQDMFTPCPDCGGYSRTLLSGSDVEIHYIEVDDEQED